MTVTSTRAWLRPRMSAASAPLNRVLMGTSTAPASHRPEHGDDPLGAVGHQMATRSPGPTPAATSAAPKLAGALDELGVGEPRVAVDHGQLVAVPLGAPPTWPGSSASRPRPTAWPSWCLLVRADVGATVTGGTLHDSGVDPTPEDHVAITKLLARYCLALDLDDVDTWVSLFTPDGVFEVYGRTWEGHEGLAKMMRDAPGGLHLGGPTVIEMSGPDRATTTQNLLFAERGTDVTRHSVYTDELRRTGDGWRIARRRCQFIVADGLSDRPAR